MEATQIKNFFVSNFKLILSKNFNTSPGIIYISEKLSAYNEIYVSFHNIAPSAANNLVCTFRINGTWVDTGNKYTVQSFVLASSILTTTITADNKALLTGNLDNGDSTRRRRSASGYMRIYSPNNLNIASSRTTFFSEIRYISSVGSPVFYKVVGFCDFSGASGTKLEGIAINIAGTNSVIANGLIKIYGRL